MNETTEETIRCPCCDEQITVLIDRSVAEQQYVEDCEICCRPLLLTVSVAAEVGVAIAVQPENE